MSIKPRSSYDAPPSLDTLRQEIDEIDNALHALIRRRTEVVHLVRAAKRGGPSIRPSREAAIMRRLVERHSGDFPEHVVLRLWREIISVMTALQGDHAVAVPRGPDFEGFWDLSRSHFGSIMPLQVQRDVPAAIDMLLSDRCTVAVVPWPGTNADDGWWSRMPEESVSGLGIAARLPFIGVGNGRSTDVEALAIGRFGTEPTGEDRSLIVLSVEPSADEDDVVDRLGSNGLEDIDLLASLPVGSRIAMAIDVAGFVTADDAVFDVLAGGARQWLRVEWAAPYAIPLNL